VIALGGNPNVGKSTLFNQLTGLRQHTGNWPGKTVTTAQGYCTYQSKTSDEKTGCVIVDLPGCYSLMAHSAEEEVARDFICFGGADAVIIVCDATCLERSLSLVLQTLEMTDRVVVCVNLMDEAEKKNIGIDLPALSQKMGVPVVGTSARGKKGLDELMDSIEDVIKNPPETPVKVQYPGYIERAVSILEPCVKEACESKINSRWLSLTLLNWDQGMHGFIGSHLNQDFLSEKSISPLIKEIRDEFEQKGITEKRIKDDIVSSIVATSEVLCKDTVRCEGDNIKSRDMRIDRILTGKWTAFPIMVLGLLGIFWLTITGANYPSRIISDFLFWVEDRLLDFFYLVGAPEFLSGILVLGVYRVLAWVVSVMLPPMFGSALNQTLLPQ